MKKRLISVLLVAAVFAMALTGCGKGNKEATPTPVDAEKTEEPAPDNGDAQDGNTEDDQTPPQELTTVTIPSYRTGEDVGAKFFLPQVERFNQKYEGIYKVVVEESPSNTHAERIKQLAVQEKLPAMFQVADSKWVEEYLIANNKLQDLTQFINDRPDMKKLLIQDSTDFCTKDSKVIAMPMTVMKPTGIFYNSALFNPSKSLTQMSWEDFSKELGENKIAYQTAEGGWTINLMLTAILGGLEGGPELLTAGVETKITDFNQPQLVEAFKLLQESFIANGWESAIGAAYPDAANTFYGNKTAILPDGTWIIDKVYDDTDWANGFDGTKVVGDYFPGNVAIANPCVYDWMIPAGLPQNELDLALTFMEFINTPEEIEAFILAEGGSAPNLTYSESFKTEMAKNSLLNDFATKLNGETRYVPYFNNAIAESLFLGDFTNMMTYLYKGDWTPEKFCEELTKAAQQ